jgi:hypothetical protein
MQDLRLIGVHEDGVHLILADEEGERFSLPLDGALRSAARRDHPRPGQLSLELGGSLRPKDVQAMIRAGLSAEEVAERAGWTVEKVHRYEGPILAEREHVAGLARQVRLRARGGAHGATPTLGERVTERLRSREIDASGAWWDSRRADRGSWTVLLTFTAGGRQRQAAWDFDPLARTVAARDDEALWLSEDEAAEMPGPIPAPHLAPAHRPTRLYDVEAEGGIGAPARGRPEETVDLMAAMRERSAQRGRRRRTKVSEVPGIERTPVEALPITELAADLADAGPPPAAHPHPSDDPEARPVAGSARLGDPGESDDAHDGHDDHQRHDVDEDRDAATADDSASSRDDTTPEPRRPLAASRRKPRAGEGSGPRRSEEPTREIPMRASEMRASQRRERIEDTLDTEDIEDEVVAGRARRTGTDALAPSGRPGPTGASNGQAASAPKPKPPPARRSGRPSVPSWDDIMFGRKPD